MPNSYNEYQITTKNNNIEKAVIQEDIISTKLFPVALEDIFKTLNYENKGISVNARCTSIVRHCDPCLYAKETPNNATTTSPHICQSKPKEEFDQDENLGIWVIIIISKGMWVIIVFKNNIFSVLPKE